MNTTEIIQPNLFPFPFPHHLIFCCVAMIFFAFMYVKFKKPYQLVMAAAIPFSLVVWLSTSRVLFYAVGLVELIALLMAIVLTVIHKKKNPQVYVSSKSVQEDSSEDETETVSQTDK